MKSAFSSEHNTEKVDFQRGKIGLMVSALDCGPSSLGLTPGWDIVLCSWARHLTFTVPLSTQVYKWVLANLMLGVTLR